MRKMGGLRKYMPITYWTAVIGALALCGIPAVSRASSPRTPSSRRCASPHTPGAGIAYAAVLGGRVHHRAVYLPHDLHDVPREGALRCRWPRARRATWQPGRRRSRPRRAAAPTEHGSARPRTRRPAARVSLGGDRAADRAGDSLDLCGLGVRRPPAVRGFLRRVHLRRPRPRPAGQAGARNGTGRRRSRCTGSWACRSGWPSAGSSRRGISI